MLKPDEKTLLPFTSFSQIDVNAEEATVFCLAELNRKKGGGFFKKEMPEKLVYVSKLYYPFWLVSYREATLLLEGLNISSHTMNYTTIPNVKAFKEELKKVATRQVHASFLSNSQNFFEETNEEKKLVIDGDLNDDKFVMELLDYVKEATKTRSPLLDCVLVSPVFSEEGVVKMLQNIENQRLQFQEELEDLKETIKLLNLKAQETTKTLNEEIESTKKRFDVEIEKKKKILDVELAKINKEYANQVTKASNKYAGKTTELQKKLLKLEKTKSQITSEIEHAEAEIKTAAINKDDSGEQQWRAKREELKNSLPEPAQLREYEKQISEIDENRKTALFQLKQETDSKIKEASAGLLEVETNRDAEIKVCQNEMEKIEDLTSNIIMKVDSMAKNREGLLLEFDEIGIRQKRNESLLFYVPFYMSCYQTKNSKRFEYIAPSTIRNGTLGARLRAMGKSMISQVFQPRSTKIMTILNRFIGLLGEDIVFRREISEACLKANLLEMNKTREEIKLGLSELIESGWLSEKEKEAFSQLLS